MTSRSLLAIFTAATAAIFTGCGDDDSTEYSPIVNTTLTNVEVTEFKLAENSRIATNLDSLFFSINLEEGRIFNADSLPVGSRRGKAIVTVTLPTVSKAEFQFTASDGASKTVDYLTNPSDSIDFTNNDVKLVVVSADNAVMREYHVSLNIHKVQPDTLVWSQCEGRTLTVGGYQPTASRTTRLGDTFYTLVTNAAGAAISYNTNPADRSVTSYNTVLPAGADEATFASFDGKLYIVANNILYSSDPVSGSWTSTGIAATHIYGVYADQLMCARRNADGTYVSFTYPSISEVELPQDCPVANTSAVINYVSEWSTSTMLTFTGGRTASGKVTGATWAFDGNKWACISVSPIPELEGVGIAEYYSIHISNQWVVSTAPMLLAFGGRDAEGQLNSKVYASVDRGVHWAIAPSYMQPDAPQGFMPSVFVYDQTMYPESASRASRPIESWTCPYIYIYGGTDASGKVINELRRGVIGHFTLMPIQ